MADVAARAGVSVATVSRALSGDGRHVRPAVLERVRQAAEELGYHQNNLARNMRSGGSPIIGLVISDIGNPFFTAVARGAEDFARRLGYSLVLSNTDENPEREAASLGVMAAERAAGVLLATANETQEALGKFLAVGIPIVAIDRRIDGFVTDAVSVDNETAAYEAVAHLIRLGHEDIAMVGGPPDANTARDRFHGYARALSENRIRRRPELFGDGHFRESGGYNVARALLGLTDRPTAIFAVNNLTTIGVLRALREQGVRIPEEVSLVGFDDIPTGEFLDPPLTVIAQPTYQIGARAAELLIRRIQDPEAPIREVLLNGTLVVRGSTAPVPTPVGDEPSPSRESGSSPSRRSRLRKPGATEAPKHRPAEQS